MYNRTFLDNGIRIVTERMPFVRSVSVGFWIDVGSRDEHDLNNGCAHFAEHMFFKGTRQRSAEQIAIELDGMGGLSNAFTSKENTCFYAKVLDHHLPNIVELLLDLFLNSTFEQEEVERERQVIIQEMGMVEDMPEEYLHDLFGGLFWGNHPLRNSVLGSREVVANMSSQKISHYVTHTYAPQRILISASGNVDHQEFVGLLAGSLEKLPVRTGPSLRQIPVIPPPQQAVFQKDLEQVHMMLGVPGLAVIAEERYKLLLLNIILGGNMSSRLFQTIREKHGLAYAVYSFVAPYADCGCLGIYVGVDRETVNLTLSMLAQELKKIRTQTISDEELCNAKEYAKSELFLAAENTEARMIRLAQNELYFGRDIPLAEVVDQLDPVTSADLLALSFTILEQEGMTAVAFGPVTENDVDWEPVTSL